jgi:hypothetical protein
LQEADGPKGALFDSHSSSSVTKTHNITLSVIFLRLVHVEMSMGEDGDTQRAPLRFDTSECPDLVRHHRPFPCDGLDGVYGGIPTNWANCTTAACNTHSSGTVADSSIAEAISSAPDQSVIVFPAGTFTISAITISRDNVIFRGQGADQTRLIFNGSTASCNGDVAAVGFCIAGSNNWSGGLQNQATWIAGFSVGTTVITLGSA